MVALNAVWWLCVLLLLLYVKDSWTMFKCHPTTDFGLFSTIYGLTSTILTEFAKIGENRPWSRRNVERASSAVFSVSSLAPVPASSVTCPSKLARRRLVSDVVILRSSNIHTHIHAHAHAHTQHRQLTHKQQSSGGKDSRRTIKKSPPLREGTSEASMTGTVTGQPRQS